MMYDDLNETLQLNETKHSKIIYSIYIYIYLYTHTHTYTQTHTHTHTLYTVYLCINISLESVTGRQELQ